MKLSFACRVLCLGALLVSAAAPAGYALDVTAGAQVGAGWLPMNDWEDVFASGGSYDADEAGLYGELFATLQVRPRHALRVSVERIATSASLVSGVEFGAGPSTAVVLADWDFSTIPVCVSYEYTLRRSPGGARSIVAGGGGLYFSKVEADLVEVFNPDPNVSFGETGVRDGTGYGFHAYFRQTAPVSDRLSLTGMLRGRWADGMAFDDSDGDIAVEFSGVDLSVGVQWAF